ncbi:hypothetical protein GCM10028775_47840 [Catellatospora paridis]
MHVSGEPAAGKIAQVMMVRLARRKTAVGRQAVSRAEIITHRTRLTLSLPQAADEAGDPRHGHRLGGVTAPVTCARRARVHEKGTSWVLLPLPDRGGRDEPDT